MNQHRQLTLARVDQREDGAFIIWLYDSVAFAYRPYVYPTDNKDDMERAISRIANYLSLHAKCTEDFIHNVGQDND